MNELAAINLIDKRNQVEPIDDRYKRRWIRALYLCSIGGFFVGLLGLSLIGIAFFSFVENAGVINRIGTWLIVGAFPLIMFGAHAMDKIAEIDANEKLKTFNMEREREFYSPERWKSEDFSQL